MMDEELGATQKVTEMKSIPDDETTVAKNFWDESMLQNLTISPEMSRVQKQEFLNSTQEDKVGLVQSMQQHRNADVVDVDSNMKIHPGQIRVMHFKKGYTIFRASRTADLPAGFPKQTIKTFAEEDTEDWSGRYFFMNPGFDDDYFPSIDDVRYYAADYTDENTGNGVYYVEQREAKEEFYAIFNTNRNHGTCAVTGDIKARAIKDFFKTHGLGLNDNNDENLSKISDRLKKTFSENNGKLITVLDSLGLAYLGPLNEDEDNELILGPHILDKTKAKKVVQVLAQGYDKEHESPEVFFKNTDFESSHKKNRTRCQFLSEQAKQVHHYLHKDPTSKIWNEMKLKISQGQTLEAIREMVTIAATDPSVVAQMICYTRSPPEVAGVELATSGEVHLSSLLAGVVARGGVAPLAEDWISLLHLLYEKKHLSGKNIISALLPNKHEDLVKSLAHAIVGADWRSMAATKLCALLSKIANNDEQLGKLIVERLSMTQSGYGFKLIVLDRDADFYNRAKHADKLNPNTAAKTQLKEANLIPKERKLYKRMISGTHVSVINWESSFRDLQDKIKGETTPQVLASCNKMKKENAELEQAKISAKEKLNDINTREKENKRKASNDTPNSAKNDLTYNQSRHDKYLAQASMRLKNTKLNQKNTKLNQKSPVVAASSSINPYLKTKMKASRTPKVEKKNKTEEKVKPNKDVKKIPRDHWRTYMDGKFKFFNYLQ